MGIYTKKGDKGRTSLGSGVKVWKNSERVEAYGTVDELNSHIGVAAAEFGNSKKSHMKYLVEILKLIQDDLFSIGSYLSNPANSHLLEGLSKRTLEFEKEIDKMTEKMPELTNFILPGGGKAGAQLQVCRTVSRRAERNLVALSRSAVINPGVLQYINRLSDLFFTMSRYANHKENAKEIIWKRR